MTRRMIFVVLAKMDECDCENTAGHVHVVGVRTTQLEAYKLADEWDGWWEGLVINDGIVTKPRKK